MPPFRVLDFTLALSLAFAPLVMPLLSSIGQARTGLVVGTAMSALVAVAVLAHAPNVESRLVWKFGGLTFLVSAGVHLLTGTGANAGDASPIVVVAAWAVSVIVGGTVVFRN
ncbi:hypothetical protein [Halorussus litoreus]|uniref:hypothetical protein n=1 Tax=Halorussus litoreus TaxID=1710536 RepID=UPI000E25F85A|nr:hypothetical protein [Halorussus litoreus]